MKMTTVSSNNLGLGAEPAVTKGNISALGMSDLSLPTISSPNTLSEGVSLM